MRRTAVLAFALLAIFAAVLFVRSEGSLEPDVETRDPAPRDVAPSPPSVIEPPSVDAAIDKSVREPAASADPTLIPESHAATDARILAVRVLDAVTKRPLEAIRVEFSPQRVFATPPAPLIHLDGTPTARKTDEHGIARFEWPVVGRSKVRVDDLAATSDDRLFDLPEVKEFTLELLAWRTAELHGRIVDATGTPIEDASLSVWPLFERTHVSNEVTRHDGSFVVDGIQVREGGVRGVRSRIQVTHRRFLDRIDTESTLVAGHNELGAPLVLARPAASICGRVVDALGQPMANETVLLALRIEPRPRPREMRTDPNGAFSFEGLEAGSYVVVSEANCHGETSPIVVAEGAALDLGDLRAPPTRFEISGIAVFEDGAHAVGATVHFGRESREVGTDGAFSFWRCDASPRELVFKWREPDASVYWRQSVPAVSPGGSPLRVVLVPRGVVFELVDATTRELLTERRLEITAFGASSSSKSYSIPQTRGRHTLDWDGLHPPYSLRFVVEGYAPLETTLSPPQSGYTERTVVELAFRRRE